MLSLQELDFVNEGKNAERCADDLRHLDYIYVPKVYWDYTNSVRHANAAPVELNWLENVSQRILTAEWIDGYKITDIESIQRDKFPLKEIDNKLFNIFAEQIFNSGFVHADPHAGNVFLRKNKKGKPEIVLLDHGLYEHMPEQLRRTLCQFWEAIVLKDRNKMEKYANELNVQGKFDMIDGLSGLEMFFCPNIFRLWKIGRNSTATSTRIQYETSFNCINRQRACVSARNG